MKKLSILLIGLLLVSGLAFADFGDVDVSGDASVTFGVDLDTNATGFANAASSSLTITLVDEGSGTTGGDDGLYGEITLTDWSAEASSDDTISVTGGSVSAKIVVDPLSITIYSAPSFSLDMAAQIDTGATAEGNVTTAMTGTNTIGGVTISLPAGPATVDLKIASDGDWDALGTNGVNVNNDYGVGVDVTLDVAPATVDLGVIYGWFGAAVIGVSAGVELDVAPATVTLGFDGDATATFDFDIAAGVALELMEGADVSLDAYINPDTTTDLDVVIGFEEEEDGGIADMLYATVDVGVFDALATLEWAVDVAGGYDTGDVDPYFGFGYGSDSVFDLNVGVILKAGLTGIDNTTVTLDYVSTDLSNDNGVITVEAAIAY